MKIHGNTPLLIMLTFNFSRGFFLAVLIGMLSFGSGSGRCQEPQGQSFANPDTAVDALQSALTAANLDELGRIFGPGIGDIINPDLVQATNEFQTVASAIGEARYLLPAATNRMILQYGRDSTLFPVPLVESGGRWFFDTAAGAEEIVNRRIGRNELSVLETLRTCVQAQREYASADRDGDEVLEYARRFRSTDGKKDGLFWHPWLDGTISPLGPFAADAEAEGYSRIEGTGPQPFHGYYFKILTSQGRHAPGGAYNYIINGNMIGGFSFVAWPAEYNDTGVMTFMVSHHGRVYQKDLGPKTGKKAKSISKYDPDDTWTPSRD